MKFLSLSYSALGHMIQICPSLLPVQMVASYNGWVVVVFCGGCILAQSVDLNNFDFFSGPGPIPIIIGVLVSILLLTLIGIAFCCYKWRAKLVPVKKTIFAPKKTQQSR